MLGLKLRQFARPAGARTVYNIVSRTVAKPHTPAAVPEDQAPNYTGTWSKQQQPRTDAMVGPRFEQTNQEFQPRPLAAIELISQVPITLVQGRSAVCDGGGGALGHPTIFINLDQKGPHACHYCGLRFEKDDHHHGHH